MIWFQISVAMILIAVIWFSNCLLGGHNDRIICVQASFQVCLSGEFHEVRWETLMFWQSVLITINLIMHQQILPQPFICFVVVCIEVFVGCLASQQHASVSQGWTCSDYFTYCHTEIEIAGQTFHLTQPQYTDTGPTSPSTDPITQGAWQGSHRSANF